MRRLAVVATCLVVAGCGQASRVATSPAPTSTGSSTVSSTAVTSPAVEETVPSVVTGLPLLSPRAREALARARRDGARTVALTVSTEPGHLERVVAGLRELGAAVESSDAAVGYVRAGVPVDAAEQVALVEGVRQVDVDEPLSNGDPTP